MSEFQSSSLATKLKVLNHSCVIATSTEKLYSRLSVVVSVTSTQLSLNVFRFSSVTVHVII